MVSLQQPVRRMAAHIPSIFASSDALRAVERVADSFPAAISDCFCFEVGLGEESSSVDFAFLCKQGSTGAEILAGRSPIALNEDVFASQTWTTVRRFCREWTTAGSSGHEHIKDVWVEFDIARQHAVPVPCIIVSAGIGRHHPADVAWLEPALDALGVAPSRPLLQRLQRLRSSAMANGFHLGVTCSGVAARARVVFYGVTGDVLRSLADWGLPDASEFAAIGRDLLELTDIISVGIEVGDAIEPGVALECKFKETVRMDTPRWSRLLDYFVSLGCCTPASRAALLEWPGGSVERLSHRLLPATVVRKISHFEIVRQPGAAFRGKAYLFSVLV
jgi:hypothetical protein